MNLSDKSIKFYTLFSLIYIFPLLLALENYYYIDDLARSLWGFGWDHDGRILSTKVIQLISFGEKSIDLFPYSNILASLILALGGFFISEILKIEKNQKIKFSGLLLLTSPFMLENISYKWDSLPMSVSIISVIIPFLFINNYKKFIITSTLGLIICLFTYQASIVIYGLITFCLIISYSINKTEIKEIIYLLKFTLISCILSFLLFKATILFLNIDYKNRDSTIFSSPDTFILLKNNTKNSFRLIKKAFNLPLKNHFFTNLYFIFYFDSENIFM
ncbi:hypothetical protein ETU08_04880 [Apibacter muscae]|uniref:glucosyltransferase domain-containing protein n=1 Tax=Apibacter muscae TaxID=2509004 RepID=UPI0011ACFC71|nr:glucosyltransferase domain-containing protein [Apibacter muscae]TWP30433.1 hypothetical protein ETU08_04880 [Apibacter muscae]